MDLKSSASRRFVSVFLALASGCSGPMKSGDKSEPPTVVLPEPMTNGAAAASGSTASSPAGTAGANGAAGRSAQTASTGSGAVPGAKPPSAGPSAGAGGTVSDVAGASANPSDAPATCASGVMDANQCEACVQQGLVAGIRNGPICQYLGVPYAKPTSGERRFMPPEPMSSWSGVRQALEFGPACPQEPDLSFAASTSEDCLYLNVFAPAPKTAEQLPVMVFLHGGGYLSGAANMYGGRGLAELYGVVVVTMNYRLASLGFFAHPELDKQRPDAPSGSDGIRDQQAALRWVRDNIASFGGNPGNVTLFGESAGAAAVNVHMVSPGSRGLVQRFILESGASTKGAANGIAPMPRSAMYARTERMAEDLCPGAGDVMTCLRQLPVEKILQWKPTTDGGDPALLNVMFVPVIEGPGGVLPDEPEVLLKAGRYNQGEVLIGTNRFEYGLFQNLNGDTIESAEQLRAKIDERFAGSADAVMQLYAPVGSTDPNQSYVTLMTDVIFRCPTRRLARLVSSHEPVFLYSFEAGEAQHANELTYVFGPENMADGLVADFAFLFPASLVEAIQRYWTNFAHNGDPNRAGTFEWPRYDASSDKHIVLSDPLSMSSGLQRDACDFWDRYVEGM